MRRVYAYVVADLLHIGHVRHLQRAKSLGDQLIVGVLSTGAAMEKKPKPVVCQARRMKLISALQCVDRVVQQETYSPLENVKRYRPDVLVESMNHREQPANGWCAEHGIRVVGLPYTHGISSSKIKERILDALDNKKNNTAPAK